ncbi:MAG: protein kinase [Gammaproteobacteria bacterium]
MSTEPRRVTNTEIWAAWENQVVNGVYPLRRFVGASRHSAVFLTEYTAESPAKHLTDVAIKLVPDDSTGAEAQLAQWAAAAAITHPHLIRLFDSGRCQLGGRGFLFVVMEYAEQTLADILQKRALVAGEVREMLPPMLDALAFLHRNHLVHGHLKPSNLMAVDDRLKLTSDRLRPTGHSANGVVRKSLYDPPELSSGTISAAGDVWALGITLVEALTQRTWARSRERGDTGSLLAGLPAPFADTVRRCLSRTPADRPTIVELEAQYNPTPRDAATPAPQPPATEAPSASEPSLEASTPQHLSGSRVSALVVIAGALLIFLIAWAVLRS